MYSQVDENNQIKTYQYLNQASIKNGLVPVLYMYYFIRELDGKGQGYVDYDKFLKYLSNSNVKLTQLDIALKHSQCDWFFTVEQNARGAIIRYASLLNIGRKLNLDSVGITVDIPVSKIKTRKYFQAHIYSTLFRSKKDTFIFMSRARITELTGLSKQCQLNYEKLADIEKEFNIACHIIPYSISSNTSLLEEYIKKTVPERIYELHLYSLDGNRLVWQLPNQYKSHNVRAYKGKQTRANKTLRREYRDRVSNDVPKQVAYAQILYKDTSKYVGFTDQTDSLIPTNFKIDGKNVFRFNHYAPTKELENAVPHMMLSEHKCIVPDLRPKPNIEVIEI